MPAGPSVVVRVGEARRDRLVLLMARLNGADRLVLACEACPGDQALPAPAAAVGDNRSPACGAVRPAGRRAPRGPGRGARSRTRPVREPPCSTPPSARVPALNEDLVVTPNAGSMISRAGADMRFFAPLPGANWAQSGAPAARAGRRVSALRAELSVVSPVTPRKASRGVAGDTTETHRPALKPAPQSRSRLGRRPARSSPAPRRRDG